MNQFNIDLNSKEKKWALTPITIGNENYYWYRLEIPVESNNLPSWLSKQFIFPKTYWSSREQNFEIAGVGSILSILDLPYPLVSEPLEGNTTFSLRLFGGTSFSLSERKSSLWKCFPDSLFFLPRYEYIYNNSCWTFAINTVSLAKHPFSKIFSNMPISLTTSDDDLPSSVEHKFNHTTHYPPLNQWKKNLDVVLEKIKTKELSKIVLARQTTLAFSNTPCPYKTLKRLKEETVNCYHFLLQLSSQSTFLGASPERLYQRVGDQIQTEALAGTRPRGSTEKEDQALAEELLANTKEREEILHVHDYIHHVLSPLCKKLTCPENHSVMKTANVQHLFIPFKGTLKSNIKDPDIIRTLHPTPAMCGTPLTYALHYILDLEPFDRGWYAGPIGWIGNDSAELAVGIRSCLLKGKDIHLFSGGGILKDSIPQQEWEELDHKTRTFQNIFS